MNKFNPGKKMDDLYDEIGPWSKEKLELLREYLAAYSNILHTQAWCKGIHYIDAFSGGVWHLDKKDGTLVKGSPVLALQTHPPFDTYTFIDKNKSRIEKAISPLTEQFPLKKIKVIQGDCNEILKDKLIPVFSGLRDQRAFIFLDPYGINLPWDTIEAIGKTKKCDVFINFSVMGIYRQCGDKPPTGELKEKIDRVMGSSDWFPEVYAENLQLSLLGGLQDKYVRRNRELAERLADFYRKRLKTCFKHVSNYVMMRMENNAPLYALVLASNAETAVRKMHEIFRRVEKKKGDSKWPRQK